MKRVPTTQFTHLPKFIKTTIETANSSYSPSVKILNKKLKREFNCKLKMTVLTRGWFFQFKDSSGELKFRLLYG